MRRSVCKANSARPRGLCPGARPGRPESRRGRKSAWSRVPGHDPPGARSCRERKPRPPRRPRLPGDSRSLGVESLPGLPRRRGFRDSRRPTGHRSREGLPACAPRRPPIQRPRMPDRSGPFRRPGRRRRGVGEGERPKAAAASATALAISDRGCMAPVSLLTAITATRALSFSTAAAILRGSTLPSGSGPTKLTPIPSDLRRRASS